MKIKDQGNASNQSDLITEVDHQPLIDLFDLLLEWDMKDAQEEAEKRKKVS